MVFLFRKPKNSRGRKLPKVRVQRYLCKTHHEYLSFIPSQLLPHLHYVASLVNHELQQHVYGNGGLTSSKPHWKTVKRWVAKFTANLDSIQQRVWERMMIGTPKPGIPEHEPWNRKPLS